MASFLGSSRGGFAPRRGRGRGGRAPLFAKTREPMKPDLEKHPLGDLVKEICSSDLSLKPIDLAEISDCQYAASYNWLNDEVPTIVIPGKPPQWTPLHAPQRLKEDSGQYFRDPNAAKYPDYPMAPVVHAVLEAPISSHAFRFNVELVGETVFFIRKENDPKEVIKDIRGFGHTFPEAYTMWEHSVKGSETHQRIIRYEFGGLDCLVRFESDGYIREAAVGNETAPAKTAVNQDDLLQEFRNAAISQPLNTTISKPDAVKIKHGGSAISNFIVAYHDGSGLFEDIRVQNVHKDVQAWAGDNRDGIRRFATLLNNIVDIARSNASKLLEVYCLGTDRLEIRNQYGDGVHALPADLVDRWEKTKMGVVSAQYDNASEEFKHGDGGVDLADRYDLSTDSDDSSSEPDYTVCSAHDCGYCGKCTY
ncbi:hypothetical protein EJ07DRAFT_162150 [Lizonia empirigonia]|nr:hypothetical protein EJ07DRAFT_162150 [Lizonia empirigonia]